MLLDDRRKCLLRNIFFSGFGNYFAEKGQRNCNADAVETSLGLSWKQTQGAAGYQIYQYSAASDQYEMVADVEGESTSYTVSGLTGATEYKFKIRAYEKIMTMYWRAVFRMFTAM